MALFAYGNVKYAFKKLSTEPATLDFWLDGGLSPISLLFTATEKIKYSLFMKFLEMILITLVNLIQKKIKEALDINPHDKIALREKEKSQKIIEKGIRNYGSYLASDYIDIYVASTVLKA